MDETIRVVSALHTLVSLTWVLLDFVIAGIVIYRFRSTLSSWFIAGGFVFFAVVRIINSGFSWLVMPHVQGDFLLVNVVSNGIFMSLYSLTCLVIACGVGLIPRSLRQLAESST